MSVYNSHFPTEEYAGHVLLGSDLARPCLGHPALLGQTESGLFEMFSMWPDKLFGGPTVRQQDRCGAAVMLKFTQYPGLGCTLYSCLIQLQALEHMSQQPEYIHIP